MYTAVQLVPCGEMDNRTGVVVLGTGQLWPPRGVRGGWGMGGGCHFKRRIPGHHLTKYFSAQYLNIVLKP